MRIFGGLHQRYFQPNLIALYWRSTLVLLASCCFLAIGIHIVGQRPVTENAIFTGYSEILPGEPQAKVTAHGFDCQNKTNYYSMAYATCTLTPKDGMFSRIVVLTTKDVIVQSTFYVSSGALRFGDLMVSMQISQIYRLKDDLSFFWHNLFVNVGTSQLNKAVALRPLSSVTFTDVNYQWPQKTFTGVS